MNCDKFTNVFFNGQERGVMLTYINAIFIAVVRAVTGVTAQIDLEDGAFS